MNFEKLYIQKMPTQSGGTTTTYPMKETISDFDVYCMDIPFRVSGSSKSLPSNDWPDEDGLEEWIPSDGIPVQAYDIEVRFGYRYFGRTSPYDLSSPSHAESAIRTFVDYLSGRDGTGTRMMIYSEHTGIGRKDVRFVSMDDKTEYYKSDAREVAVFSVTLKVDDPVTRVERSGSSLVEV